MEHESGIRVAFPQTMLTQKDPTALTLGIGTVAANGGRGKSPLWTMRKFSIDLASHTDLQNEAEFSPKGKPIRIFSFDTDTIGDAVFCGRHVRDFNSNTTRY